MLFKLKMHNSDHRHLTYKLMKIIREKLTKNDCQTIKSKKTILNQQMCMYSCYYNKNKI